jgi:hypothetical protein
MKELSKVWWGVCLTLLGLANVMLFVYMMLMAGFWSRITLYPLAYLFSWAFLFSYYCAAPIAAFGFICAIGCSMSKQTERAALLAALSGGALFSAILVWGFLHL